eukprot:TRINITY_DN25155_c0_g1_i2.p1 TRINITY_DN25155_c0_g1~~TRINITY_DN25155_c0_g1_i2.p1  ORF type:complete len:242 (-),score=46.32 TRINITY_DN25155_c0_g1_i2:106-831(-)
MSDATAALLEGSLLQAIQLWGHKYDPGNIWNVDRVKYDYLVWHHLVAIEWSHGRYVSVVELAHLNGASGRGGGSPWYEESARYKGRLWDAFLEAKPLMAPFFTDHSEIRFYDLDFKDFTELKAYFHKYDEKSESAVKFVAPEVFSEHHFEEGKPALSRKAFTEAVLNYLLTDWMYHEQGQTCQTFARDLWEFLTGQKPDDQGGLAHLVGSFSNGEQPERFNGPTASSMMLAPVRELLQGGR